MKLEIVIAHYNEPLDWLNPLAELPIRLYYKGDLPRFSALNTRLVPLPNIGRETHTYLHHIVSRYDELPDVTVFAQGNPFDHAPQFVERVLQLNKGSLPLEGYLPLSDKRRSNDGAGRPHHKETIPLKDTYEEIFERPAPPRFVFSPGAIMAVSREVIQQQPRTFYERLLAMVSDEARTERLGFCFERLWPHIFVSLPEQTQPVVGSVSKGVSTTQFFTANDKPVLLNDLYLGATCFLLCGGPSLAKHDLSLLSQRGILTMAVNNAATVFKPNLWTHVDKPGNFVPQIWQDATITKFTPLSMRDQFFRVRDENNKLVASSLRTQDCPNVLFYRRNETFNHQTYLSEPSVNWGCSAGVADSLGQKASRSVMLAAMKILYVLGVRRVFLLGCDFKMTLGAQNYAFAQNRAKGSVNNNNRTYQVLNARFAALRPLFEEQGFSVYNCTPQSGLKAFDFMGFEQAVEAAASPCAGPILTEGHYDT